MALEELPPKMRQSENLAVGKRHKSEHGTAKTLTRLGIAQLTVSGSEVLGSVPAQIKIGMVAHTCTLSAWEVKAR